MTTRQIVELLEPLTRGGTRYAAGHQFAVVRALAATVEVRDGEGRRVRFPRRAVAEVRAAVPATPRPTPQLADLLRAGLLRTAATLTAPAA